MTDLKIGSVYLKSYTGPTCWKLYTIKRSKKTGKMRENLIGWYGTLPQALRNALRFITADSDAQSVAELLEKIETFHKAVEEEIKREG